MNSLIVSLKSFSNSCGFIFRISLHFTLKTGSGFFRSFSTFWPNSVRAASFLSRASLSAVEHGRLSEFQSTSNVKLSFQSYNVSRYQFLNINFNRIQLFNVNFSRFHLLNFHFKQRLLNINQILTVKH